VSALSDNIYNILIDTVTVGLHWLKRIVQNLSLKVKFFMPFAPDLTVEQHNFVTIDTDISHRFGDLHRPQIWWRPQE
jgi:hypothetical protein